MIRETLFACCFSINLKFPLKKQLDCVSKSPKTLRREIPLMSQKREAILASRKAHRNVRLANTPWAMYELDQRAKVSGALKAGPRHFGARCRASSEAALRAGVPAGRTHS